MGIGPEFLTELEHVIVERIQSSKSDSYVQQLVSSGFDRALKKVGEEAGEVIIAAKNTSKEDLINESADLIFHLMIVLSAKGYSIQDVIEILKSRHDANS